MKNLVIKKSSNSQRINTNHVLIVFPFISPSLSAKEKADIEYKRRVLRLAKEHEQAGEVEKVNRYYMPEDGVKPQDR